ncbi:MAG: hypothetical protein ACE37J_14235 [Pikeienuella sp.]|uniref:hypothetical protein n=1 Tax=Pikeienuella sp. TaxID=2831957 RepID=UPI00391C54F5
MKVADPPPDLRTHTRSGVEREEVWRLASRPAWSIRSRRGALAPFLDLIRSLFRRRR